MAKKSIDIEITANAKKVKRELDDIDRAAEKAGESLEDVGTAGEQMARAIAKSADDMIDEIDATKRAVDALEQALGPGFDADTRDVVADLKKLGLTAADIETDADELAAALRRVDDVKVHAAERGFEDLGQAVGRVDDDIGRAGDTMSGFVGGTIGELPGISDAMGPVGEGLGQLAEGALAGEINMKALGATAAGMALVAIALKGVQGRLERIAAFKAWETEQVEAYEEALSEVRNEAEAVALKIKDAGELQVKALQGILDVDVVPHMAAAGLSAEQFGEIVAGGTDKLDQWKAAAEAAGVDTEHIGAVALAASQEMGLLDQAQAGAAATAIVFGESAEEASAAADRHAASVERAAAALLEETDALLEQIDAQRASVDAGYALTDAQYKLGDTVAATAEALSTAEAGSREHTEASIELAQAAQDVADAEARAADELNKAAGKTTTATQRTDTMNRSLLNSASTLNGPQRQAVLDHIGRLNGIPPDKLTEISAQLDAGDIAAAEWTLGHTSRTRESAVVADANTATAEHELNVVARDRVARIIGQAVGNIPGLTWGAGKADGGPVRAGTVHPIAERGEPELLESNGRQYLIPGADGNVTPLAAGGGSGSTVVHHHHYAPGVTPTAVRRADRTYDRRNGPL